MMRALISLCAVIGIISCAPKHQASPAPVPQYIDHKVKYSGETMGLISAWYTGSSANWTSIANANPQIQVKNIRIGDVVRIPESMVRRSEPLPQDFLTKPYAKTNVLQVAKLEAKVEPQNEILSDSKSKDLEAKPANEEGVTTLTLADGTTVTASGTTTLKELEPRGKNPNNDLMMGVMTMDKAAVAAALSAGADANYKDTNRPVLAWAAQNGDVEVVKTLVDAKADLNVVDAVGHTALMRAADTGHAAVIKVLADAGADLNVKTSEGRTALFLAVYNNSEATTKALIDAGADVNALDENGDSPALTATQNVNMGLIALLATAKADFDRSNAVYTPLSYAIEQGNKELAEALLKAGANPNAKTKNGRAPLIMALDNTEMFQLLLDHKADPNITAGSGETALMTAVQIDSTERIEQLMRAGANPNAKDGNGATALTLANNMYKPEIAELLKKHGATE